MTEKKPRVLIACEYSATVRSAFEKIGCDAWSCDLLPTEIPGNHIQDDVLNHLDDNWDLMIAHPPCDYLSYAANKYWNNPGREIKRNEAALFFLKLFFAPIPKICIENPVGYMNELLKIDHQIIHPYYFGNDNVKRTVLWLKNLPKLQHAAKPDFFLESHLAHPFPIYQDKKNNKPRYRTDALNGFSSNTKKERSRFFPEIASAMALQWIPYLLNQKMDLKNELK